MTFQKFIEKWNGKYIDTDNAYGAQCMDLLHQYCVEVLGLNQSDLAAPSAKQVYINFASVIGHENFEKIPNTPTGVPQEGDIIFWGYEPYGHVAIFIEGDSNSFRSYDQNYPTGSPCHVQNHTYSNCLGWLRYKQTNQIQWLQNSDNWIALLQRYNFSNNKDLVFAEIDKLPTLEEAVRAKDKDLQIKDQQLSDLTQKGSDLEKRLNTTNADLAALSANYTASQSTLKDLQEKNDQMRKEIEELKQTPVVPVLKTWDYFMLFVKSLFNI